MKIEENTIYEFPVGNYYGDVLLKQEKGQCFISIQGVTGVEGDAAGILPWKPISKTLFNAMLAEIPALEAYDKK
jgi:hypothetical protein